MGFRCAEVLVVARGGHDVAVRALARHVVAAVLRAGVAVVAALGVGLVPIAAGLEVAGVAGTVLLVVPVQVQAAGDPGIHGCREARHERQRFASVLTDGQVFFLKQPCRQPRGVVGRLEHDQDARGRIHRGAEREAGLLQSLLDQLGGDLVGGAGVELNQQREPLAVEAEQIAAVHRVEDQALGRGGEAQRLAATVADDAIALADMRVAHVDVGGRKLHRQAQAPGDGIGQARDVDVARLLPADRADADDAQVATEHTQAEQQPRRRHVGAAQIDVARLEAGGAQLAVELERRLDVAERAEFQGYPALVTIRGYNPQLTGHPGQLKKAVELIAKAKRPVIYGGGGIIHAHASEEFRELVEITQIPTTLSLMGLGALASDHPLWLGMLGMYGIYSANMCMAHCDVMIAIGSRFDARITGKLSEFGKQCHIIHVNIDPTSIQRNVRVDVPIVGDVKCVLRDLNKELRKVKRDWVKDFEEWYAEIETWKKRHPLRYEQREGVIKPQYAIDMILRLTEEYDPIISTGVGQHQMWTAQVYRGRQPRHWLTSGGLGTMGCGFPAALGAQAAFPDRLVLNIDGDGSFQMTMQDLSTLVQYGLPVKTFIINNKHLGMLRQWQQQYPTFPQAVVAHQPDFVKLAEACGVVGIRIERPEEVKAGIEKAMNTPGPVVVDMLVARDETCFPVMPVWARP